MSQSVNLCPCCSGQTYENCCQPYHLNQANAPTAETLMRSRFAAFALHLDDYLFKTWSKSTRSGSIEFEKGLVWLNLEIVSKQKGREKDKTGKVHFKATYQMGNQQGIFEEISKFEKVPCEQRPRERCWVYLKGKIL